MSWQNVKVWEDSGRHNLRVPVHAGSLRRMPARERCHPLRLLAGSGDKSRTFWTAVCEEGD